MGAGVIALACVGEPGSRDSLKLIGSEYSELRYSPAASVRRLTTIDLTTPGGVEQVTLISADGHAQLDGLHVEPHSNDPIVLLADPLPVFSWVAVEMAATRSGVVEIFWTPAGTEFTAERSRRLPVAPAGETQRHVFELGEVLDPQTRYRLRIDPLDQQAAFVLARIELGEVAFTPERQGDEPLARKVTLGQETREALVVSSGATVVRTVSVPSDALLSFGLGSSRNDEDLTFRLTFRDDDGGHRTLFEEALSAGPSRGWQDRELSLRSLGGRSGRLEATVAAAEAARSDGAVFWANPLLIGDREAGDRPNVLLVSLDTLGASRLTAYGAADVDDGFLSRLAAQGALFERSFAASSLTHLSHGSLLTGKAPLDGNLFWFGDGSLEEATLAEALRSAGYATAAFTGGELVTASLGFDRGFERFWEENTLQKGILERSDIHQLLGRAEGWIAATQTPWLAFVHTYEVHTPYYRRDRATAADVTRPDQYLSVDHLRGSHPLRLADAGEHLWRLDGGRPVNRAGEPIEAGDVDELRRTHESEIAFLDRALAGFFDSLERQGQLANTVVVVTADHGEAFFEHGLFEHGLLHDENLRVPLIVWGPGRVPSGVRVAETVTALDLVPTLLELTGVSAAGPFAGRSLVAALRGAPLPPIDSYAFVPGDGLAVVDRQDRKLIWHLALLAENYGGRQLFDRRADPGERHDLLGATEAGAHRLELAARRLVERFPGAHLSLEPLAHQTCSLALAGNRVNEDRIYALDIERRQPLSAAVTRRWRGVVRFGEHPRLIVMGVGLKGFVDLEVSCEGGSAGTYHLAFAALGSEPRDLVPASPGASTLRAWSVPGTGSNTARGGFSEEQKERLRALGYVR